MAYTLVPPAHQTGIAGRRVTWLSAITTVLILLTAPEHLCVTTSLFSSLGNNTRGTEEAASRSSVTAPSPQLEPMHTY